MKTSAVISRVYARRGTECASQMRNMPARATQPCTMSLKNEETKVESDINGVQKPLLLLWHEISSWQQDNDFIISGYRRPSGSLKNSLRSILYFSNETINIYSHLLGALIFATLPIYVYYRIYPKYKAEDVWDIAVFSTFFFSVAICFALSATYHIISNHSLKVAALGNQLDYLGIVILMWGSTIPTVYYGFYCDPQLQKTYWSLISILALLCTITTLHSKFRTPIMRPYRAAMYASLGLSALIFIGHGITLHGLVVQNRRMSLEWMGIMAGLNLIGAGAYTARVPERWAPRRYDFIGSSHQIFHSMVVLAGLAHMIGLLKAFYHAHEKNGQCARREVYCI